MKISLRLGLSSAAALIAMASATLSGCSNSANEKRAPSPVRVPAVTAQIVSENFARASTGDMLLLHRTQSDTNAETADPTTAYFEVEGTFSRSSFNELKAQGDAQLTAQTDQILAQVAAQGAIIKNRADEVGYFTFLLPFEEDLMGRVKALSFAAEVYLNPVAYDLDALESLKALKLSADTAFAVSQDRSAYSGLSRIGAPEFVKQVERELRGARIDGSSVRLGITDTGITYNHPAFVSKTTGKNRIIYMKDSTAEGRVYFHPNAKFEISSPADAKEGELLVNAQVLMTPRLPGLPVGDKLAEIKDFKIKASAELHKELMDPKSAPKLGYLREFALSSSAEPVDINGNGTTGDAIPMILIQSEAGAKLYVDASAKGDFSAPAVGDWNKTGATVEAFAEKLGFSIEADKLLNSDGKTKVDVMSASVVGYDPGNHGSHVAGIAAGSTDLIQGVAPEAAIMMNRVCANNTGCNALNAIIDLALNKAELVNMSLGGLSSFNDGYGVQETVINRLTEMLNVLFVVSAGNSGPGRQTIGSPSTARWTLSVGAAASRSMVQGQYQWPGMGSSSPESNEDFMLFFSSRGPTAAGGFKPNVVAPGTELSAIQLNAAPGLRAGADIYWGTSMSAPTAAGAYALLLDAVKKHNKLNPSRELSTNAIILRQVLIQSARPFDVNSYDSETGQRTEGQYTWIDQGMGMINLPKAWALLKQVRDHSLPSSVQLGGNDVGLDYEVLTSHTGPNGIAYDGSRAIAVTPNGEKAPAFGTGLYVDFAGQETLLQVGIARQLPTLAALHPQLGELTRQLVTTSDDFVLKTTIYGSGTQWLKAGVLDQVDCWDSPEGRLTVIGRGAQVSRNSSGSGSLIQFLPSALNVCLDREAMQKLTPGDHGALITGYRVVDGKLDPLASFTVPVYVTVPHRTLAGSTAYETEGTVHSFGVDRNYVVMPKGARIARVTIEVPAFKSREEGCSGVELMALEGGNTLKPRESRASLRVSNCQANGAPSEAGRRLVLTRTLPKAGVWDLHVFGQYRFKKSKYKLRVDYLVAESSLPAIQGNLTALTGELKWKVTDSSIDVGPDGKNSSITLNALRNDVTANVATGAHVYVTNPLGTLRSYPIGASSVTVTTGGSPGNDIDLMVIACPLAAQTPEDAGCMPVAGSAGATDAEVARFMPAPSMRYAIRVDGYEVQDGGGFTSTESIQFPWTRGTLAIGGSGPEFLIGYTFTGEQLSSSFLVNQPLFQSGQYKIEGALTLADNAKVTLDSVPILVNASGASK